MTEDYDRGEVLKGIERILRAPQPMLRQIGAIMAAESQEAFTEQRWNGKTWKERSVPNVYGIIGDLAAGRSVPARRFEARPALRDTGRLAASITFRVEGDAVAVGTNLPYAKTLNDGGPIESEKITPAVQQALGKLLKGPLKRWRSRLGFLMNRKFTNKTLTGEVEARQFVGITQQTLDDVAEIVGARIAEDRRFNG